MVAEKMNILVVEDNLGDARLLKEAFKGPQGSEFNMVHAPGLQSALRKLSGNDHKVDYILLDLNLPGTSGLETLRKIQANTAQIPILVVTGLKDDQMALQAIRLGAQGYYCKDDEGRDALARTLRLAAERRQNGGGQAGNSAPTEPLPSTGRGASVVSLEELLAGPGDLLLSDDSDILRLLESQRMEVRFQPWVSPVERAVAGFQGLGAETAPGEPESPASPVSLLRTLNSPRFSALQDRLSRRKLLREFKEGIQKNPNLVLGLAFDIAGPDGDEKTLGDFLSMVRGLGLPPGHVVIDIQESRPCALPRLKRFAENARDHGFLLALDGSRLGHTHLDLLTDLKPDLIKAGRDFVAEIEKNHGKREILRSLVSLAHAAGSLVLAQEVETEAEALRVLELGADLVQGVAVMGPRKLDKGLWQPLEEKMASLAGKFRDYMSIRLHVKRSCYSEYSQLLYAMGRELAGVAPDAFEVILFAMAQRYPRWESLMVLDKDGRQLCRVSGGDSQIPSGPAFFKPFPAGTDHSTKDYFYKLMENRHKDFAYFTQPYLSRETRRLCVTISTTFQDALGGAHVLCAQLAPERLLIQC